METYASFCWKSGDDCKAPQSPTNLFFRSVPVRTGSSQGEVELQDINETLTMMLREHIMHFTDKDFDALNLRSKFTRGSFFGGIPLAGYDRWQTSWDEQRGKHEAFLLDLYREVLSRADDSSRPLPFQHIKITWFDSMLQDFEVQKWLFHDASWCAGTFAVVTLLLILNLRSFCLTIFGMLGVLLAFAATYFFHFTVLEYKSLTVLDFLSLFLIVGIAADDMRLGRIACLFPVSWCCGFAATASNFVQVLDPSRSALSRLILCHTFRLAPAVLGPRAGPRECMKWAYKQAGEAMLARAPAHRLTH
ncbi:DISP3 [Symbiodinium pilosum]|uniref:DISP3 protein n=1 Tax=Symbiodinium pilosum TaxID=2952 RepID=A0A812SD31_SYMPI|nr:DISP3 [Symbiodinium pilosum]